MTRYLDSILDAVGGTPLVRLARLGEGLPATILAKVESSNPGGSSKDRIAVAMVDDAERRGLLRPGGTIVEATAGNTGVGLAMVAARRGYRCLFVVPDKMSAEKIDLLKAFGAEVVVTPTAVAFDSPQNYNVVADRLAAETLGAWRASQFTNPANPLAHYGTTGPEIWDAAEGHIDAFVAGVGTGGSLSGIGRFLKEHDPRIRVIGADPEGSILSGGSGGSWKVEGIGEDFLPETFDGTLVDEWVTVTDAQSFDMARRLAREEGILAGGSSGTALFAAVAAATRMSAGSVVVVLLPDTGRNYLSKLHSDGWMRDNGFEDEFPGGATVGEIVMAKRMLPPLVAVTPSTRASDVVRSMSSYGITQVPVTESGLVLGCVDELSLVRMLHSGTDLRSLTTRDVMGPPPPLLDEHASIEDAYRRLLGGDGGVLVTREGIALGFLTRADLVQHWADRRHGERLSA